MSLSASSSLFIFPFVFLTSSSTHRHEQQQPLHPRVHTSQTRHEQTVRGLHTMDCTSHELIFNLVLFTFGACSGLPPFTANVTKEPYFTAWSLPLELINLSVPYRSLFFKSVRKFFRELYRPIQPEYFGESSSKNCCYSLRGSTREKRKSNPLTISPNKVGPSDSPPQHAPPSLPNRRASSLNVAAETLSDFYYQGIPFARFLARYEAYCFINMLSMEQDHMEVRKHIMVHETDPGVTDASASDGYRIKLYKMQTVRACLSPFTA